LWFYSSPALWQVHTRQANSFLPLNQKTYGTTVKKFRNRYRSKTPAPWAFSSWNSGGFLFCPVDEMSQPRQIIFR